MTGSDKGMDAMHHASHGTDQVAGRLRVLATTDVHSNLLSHDYYADSSNPAFGLSRTASLIARARSETDAMGGATLLLDNGDWLQGTPLAETAAGQAGIVPPAILAFAELRYDAVGLGNHEFNFGLDALSHALDALPCPALCSNLRALDPSLELPIKRSLVLTCQIAGADQPPVRVGLFSVLPPQTMMWDADHLAGRVEIDDMVDCARHCISDLRAAGADVVIALAHTGLGAAEASPGMENALRPISALPGLDAAVGGHTHLLLPAPHGPQEALDVPVVMPGFGGSHLGVIDLDLVQENEGWKIVRSHCELRAVGTRTSQGVHPLAPEDPGLVDVLAPAHAHTRAEMAKPVGCASDAQHSYFTFFGQDRALALTAAAQAAAIRPVLAESAFCDLPLLSAVAPAKFGGRAGPDNYTDVPAGPMSRRHVADLYIYPNELRCCIVTGRQVREWLEMSAGFFSQLTPEAPAMPLVDPDRAGHNFDVLFGLEYEIDPTAPAWFDAAGRRRHDGPGRIRNLRWQGTPLCDTQRFAVGLNSYRSSGGGNFHMLDGAASLPLARQLVREAVTAYVTGLLPEDPLSAAPYPWRFASGLGVEAVALTGPGARARLHELPPQVAQTARMLNSGFLALTLSL
ncbi:5'-nucleotidase C-terminal domain-containing protein [Epibacterium sp. Ofav1-8]|uniref:5'-nucleotidase C-terminal domain-containing protein n=1 Tax=Epibacterium sp. Ofav1-8 TaxID=2917735 RepID=UPI001EF63E80|nr:5'-nucleotidase C-terminal domain-containing protein [Epibacterium sp. Ofav1-8]MCG7623986.1 5'-nucleotidase C-terminal domain-containing protein [Epibacterium sp. Ofav1-8]